LYFLKKKARFYAGLGVSQTPNINNDSEVSRLLAKEKMKSSSNGGFKRGMVELILLALLKDKDMYGYQLSQELSLRSNGSFQLKETSMYPTLYRLVEKGYITSREEMTEKRKIRVYYHLESLGEQYLNMIMEDYVSISIGTFKVLKISKYIVEELSKDEQ